MHVPSLGGAYSDPFDRHVLYRTEWREVGNKRCFVALVDCGGKTGDNEEANQTSKKYMISKKVRTSTMK